MSSRFLISFYARRSLRIWPIYYLSLLLLVLINAHTAEPGSLDGLPYFATFTQNVTYYWSGSAPAFIPAFRHTWSLAIEEQFYVFWPALLWLLGRRGIPLVTAGLIGLAVTTRMFQFNRWILATHCDGLALGALLSYLMSAPSPGASDRRPRFLAIGLGAAVFWMGSALAVKFASPGLAGKPADPSAKPSHVQPEPCVLRPRRADRAVCRPSLAWHPSPPRASVSRPDQLWPLSLPSYRLHAMG